MADLIQTIEQLNKRVHDLNNERSKQMGMQESAQAQYNKAIMIYKEKYGVELTEQNLQAEYTKVYTETKTAVAELEAMIQSIERGDYKNVEKPADIELEPQVEIKVKPQITQSTVNEKGPINFGALNAASGVQQQKPPKTSADYGFVEEEELQTSQQPINTESPINFGGTATNKPITFDETEKQETVIEGEDIPDDDESSFTVEGWGNKSAPDMNANFANILNGQGSIKFGE